MRKVFVVIAAIVIAALRLQGQNSGWKIVVIKGEDAVNILQQKTAVAPVVEVRDRNNLPIPGVAVTFTVGGGQGATFGGLSTLTVTTNAAGQAAAAGFAPTAAGAVQINATALVQGQALTATITQTNVLTAAQAAGAASATGGASSGGGGGSAGAGAAAAGGGGGGLSATTIAIVGAAVGGGAIAATQVAGGGGSRDGQGQTFSGPVTGAFTFPQLNCDIVYAYNGTLSITLSSLTAPISGSAMLTGTRQLVSLSSGCGPGLAVGRVETLGMPNNTVSGSPSSITFNARDSQSIAGTPTSAPTVVSNTYVFEGKLEGGVITGTLTYTARSDPQGGNPVVGSSTFGVTLR